MSNTTIKNEGKLKLEAFLAVLFVSTLIWTAFFALFARDFMYFPFIFMLIFCLLLIFRLLLFIYSDLFDILKALNAIIQHEKSIGDSLDKNLGMIWQMIKYNGSLN